MYYYPSLNMLLNKIDKYLIIFPISMYKNNTNYDFGPSLTPPTLVSQLMPSASLDSTYHTSHGHSKSAIAQHHTFISSKNIGPKCPWPASLASWYLHWLSPSPITESWLLQCPKLNATLWRRLMRAPSEDCGKAAYGNNATTCQTAEQRAGNMNSPLSPGL